MHDMDDDLRISPVDDGDELNTIGHLNTADGRAAISERNRRHLREYLAELRRHRRDGACQAEEICAGTAVTDSLTRRGLRSRRYLLTMLTSAVQLLAELQDDAIAREFQVELDETELRAEVAELHERLDAAEGLLAECRPSVRVVEP
jgi:hypothetical protein